MEEQLTYYDDDLEPMRPGAPQPGTRPGAAASGRPLLDRLPAARRPVGLVPEEVAGQSRIFPIIMTSRWAAM